MLTPIVPTRRALVLIALAAPLALVIGAAVPSAWIVAPLAGALLLALIFLDAFLAGRLVDLRLEVPADVEVGAPGQVTALARWSGGQPRMPQMALECDVRLSEGGCIAFDLHEGAGVGLLKPSRRGTGTVGRTWLRWSGPLGLCARQAIGAADRQVRVWPNVAAVRSPALQTYLKDAQSGLIARRIRGEGSQFESLAEYQPGMDRRRIDWKSSARHVHLYAKEYETERNNQIVFAFDCGQAMCEPIAGMPRLDRAISAALATGYVALKGGDKVALFGFASHPEVSSPFVTGSGEFHRLQRAAAGLEYRSQAPNFVLGLATLASRLQRRSLIVVFSDFTDPTSAELMIESIGRLIARHLVVFVTMADEELESLAEAPPHDLDALSMAVGADQLLRQRALVTRRLRQMGVEVIEAPWQRIDMRLLDAYFEIKRSGAIG